MNRHICKTTVLAFGILFCLLFPLPGFANDVVVRLAYPYLSSLTQNMADFWTMNYMGIGGVNGTYYFTLPKHFDLGIGADYSVASLRPGSFFARAYRMQSFTDLLLHRIALTGRIAYQIEPFPFLSITPYVGNDIAVLEWTGPLSKGLSPNPETGVGFTAGASVLVSISKFLQIGPDVSYTIQQRQVVDHESMLDESITFLQFGISLLLHV
jgi:hypothetical protein